MEAPLIIVTKHKIDPNQTKWSIFYLKSQHLIQSFKFQGAINLKVFHGEVSVFGCTINSQHDWHSSISDPRKNMLIDIKNESKEKEQEVKVNINNQEINFGEIEENSSIIGISEYKDYSKEEEQFLLSIDQEVQIRNMNTQIPQNKSFFVLNKSWKQSISNILSEISSKNKILINGPCNSQKSTFTTCLINSLQSKFDKDVYVLELDTGQPNYTLAGQVCLVKIYDKILTNHDCYDVQYIKGFYGNTATPSLNMAYYIQCCEELANHFEQIQSQNKVLIVNTCGWVEGIGADMQIKVVEAVRPQSIVTMCKYNQGIKGNDFSLKVRQIYEDITYIDINNDQLDSQINVKGAVQRNRKMIYSLTHSFADEYLFNQQLIDSQSSLPLSFQSKDIKKDDFTLSKSQAFKLMTKPHQKVFFEKAALCFITEQLEMCSQKIDVLRLFNGQLVAGVKINNAQFQSLNTFEDVRVTEINFKNKQLPPLEIKFYGLIRDIDYKDGLLLITQHEIDISNIDFNALCLVHESIFRFPSSYLYQGDVEEQMIRSSIETKQSIKHYMTDIHTSTSDKKQ